jgi:hypothetical protein
MEAKDSSETSVQFQRTTRRYIPEGRTLDITDLKHINLLIEKEENTWKT